MVVSKNQKLYTNLLILRAKRVHIRQFISAHMLQLLATYVTLPLTLQAT